MIFQVLSKISVILYGKTEKYVVPPKKKSPPAPLSAASKNSGYSVKNFVPPPNFGREETLDRGVPRPSTGTGEYAQKFARSQGSF